MNSAIVNLDLSNLGNLNKEVHDLIPLLVSSLEDDTSKASVTITVNFKRMKDSATAVIVTYGVKPSYPKKAQNILCRADLSGNLTLDAAAPAQFNLPMFQVLQSEKEEA